MFHPITSSVDKEASSPHRCVFSYITPPSAALFKCCPSWIPAVQSASTVEIEFARNLVLSLFICVLLRGGSVATVSVVDISDVLPVRFINILHNV